MITPKPEIGIVWFKRDLRLTDHEPLKKAIESGLPLLLIRFFEPQVESDDHFHPRHWQFAYHCLNDVNNRIPNGGKLYPLYCDAEVGFRYLSSQFTIKTIWSHEETGVDITYTRDKNLAAFFKFELIQWVESQTNGIIRGVKDRTNWTKKWFAVHASETQNPDLQNLRTVNLTDDQVIKLGSWNLPELYQQYPSHFQKAGEKEAMSTLASFLYDRSSFYNAHISKPLDSRQSCSRLSVHLTWGSISMRQVYQAAKKAKDEAANKRNIASFMSRLQWHCHFIQKFEMEPRLEFENANRGFDDIRTEIDDYKLQAWRNGKTGYPMVDACMRCVNETGYLNFRMRAMLVSFLTHHLWQPWQAGSKHLGKQFLDFEPGIHFSQFQMQAGTHGINTIRIYNPIKQSIDHDSEGVFLKQWLPELSNVPVELIHEPWKMTPLEQKMYNVEIGSDYPAPIVSDIKASYKNASSILWAKKSDPLVKEENQRILKTHVRRGKG